MDESSSKIKKVLAILLAILFVVSLTAATASAIGHNFASHGVGQKMVASAGGFGGAVYGHFVGRGTWDPS
jgi:hypothetical protein